MRYKWIMPFEMVRQLKVDTNNFTKGYKYAKINYDKFPAVNVFLNGNTWDYNDGRHRVLAAKMRGSGLVVKSATLPKFLKGNK